MILSKGDWCHQMVRATHDDNFERLAQILSIDRRTMFMTSLVAKKINQQSATKNQQVIFDQQYSGRIIRFLNETKHSFEYELCFYEESVEILKTLKIEIPKKTLDKTNLTKLKQKTQGTNLSFSVIKRISENHWRVAIIF